MPGGAGLAELGAARTDQSTGLPASPFDKRTMETRTMNRIRTWMKLLLPLAAMLVAAAALAQGPQEGKQYVRLKAPQSVDTGKKIEVIEFFSYGCPHCADFELSLQPWMKTAPADVQVRRIPVMFQDRWVPLAKEYFTLEALGEDARLSPELFNAIHKNGMPAWQEKAFLDWTQTKGLDRKKVEDMYNSFAIAGKVNRARAQAQAYNVQSVPVIIVDGKFLVNGEGVGSNAGMLPVIDALIVKARAERPKS
jgi:protein dithiol oxidoreductase (disulfide-forming)